MIRYGSICSGIESASVAWEPLGMKAAWFAEIEPFPSAVLAHHWPEVANLGDMTVLPSLIRAGLIEAPDVLVGGTPCQAFSLSGNRKSLDDARGQLTLSYVDILNALDEVRGEGNEAIGLWENVPGVFSTKDNAFGCFLGELSGAGCELEPSGKRWGNAGCVFGPQRAIAWRVIDAQYFGLAQRRKRVFVVSSARKDFNPQKVLFESEGVRCDSPPVRETQETSPPATVIRTSQTGANGRGVETELAYTLDNSPNQAIANEVIGCLDTQCGFESVTAGHILPCRMTAFGEYATDETASTMCARDYKDAKDLVVLPINTMTVQGRPSDAYSKRMGSGIGKETDPQNTLTRAHSHAAYIGTESIDHVRRLMPVECERLQGFEDGYTDIIFKGAPVTDGHRYKALGNSKAVPCIRWVGERLLDHLDHPVNNR